MSDYFLDNYGECKEERCKCISSGEPWLGRICPNWIPSGCKSVKDLIEKAKRKKMYDKTKKD